jgi:hypothetical protein
MYGLYGQLLLIAAQFVFDGFPAMEKLRAVAEL